MGQQYMQKFEYRSASKSDFDQAWAVALQTFAQTVSGAEPNRCTPHQDLWNCVGRVCFDRR